MRLVRTSLIAVLCSVMLPGCSALSALFADKPPKTTLHDVIIKSKSDANTNMAAGVDIVFVLDDSVLSLLPKSANDWFADKGTLLNTLHNRIEVASQQVPPMMAVTVNMPPRHRDAIAVYSYVQYANKDNGVVDLTKDRHTVIELQADAVNYAGR